MPFTNISNLLETKVPGYERVIAFLRNLAINAGPDWSDLTRRRTVDVVVGLTLHCLLLTLYVMGVMLMRAMRFLARMLYSSALRVATVLGVIQPVRLMTENGQVRKQLESATLMRGAGFNLVLFQDLSNVES